MKARDMKDEAFERLTDVCEGNGLCDYCDIPEEYRSVSSMTIGCEGRRCDKAFERWLDDADQCAVCGSYYLADDMCIRIDKSDGNKVYLCEECEGRL